MDDAEPERGEPIREAVLRYLHKHPCASDSLLGICDFWLPREGVRALGSVVEEVLEQLVAEGRIRCIELPDGTRVYARSEVDAGAE